MFSVFLSTELLNFVVRLLRIRIPNESLGTNDQPWHASHFNSLMVLKHIITLPQYTKINCRQIMEANTVEALLDFCDADFDLLGLYPAVCALKTLTCLEREPCDRIVLLSGISKIGKIVLKDNCQKMIVKAYKSEITSNRPYIKRVLEDRRDQCLDNFKRAELPSTADLPLNILRSWSYKIQMNAAVVLLKVSLKKFQYHFKLNLEKIILCCHYHTIKSNNANHLIQKVQHMVNRRRWIYKKPHQGDISYVRCLGNILPKYILCEALYGYIMLVSLWGTQIVNKPCDRQATHTVPLKGKLTVTRSRDARLDSRFSKLSRIECRGSSLEFWWLRIKDRVLNFESRKRCLWKFTLTFYYKNHCSVHWVRPIRFRVNETRALKPKMFASGLLVIILLKLAF